jgi:hypothetical protein
MVSVVKSFWVLVSDLNQNSGFSHSLLHFKLHPISNRGRVGVSAPSSEPSQCVNNLDVINNDCN